MNHRSGIKPCQTVKCIRNYLTLMNAIPWLGSMFFFSRPLPFSLTPPLVHMPIICVWFLHIYFILRMQYTPLSVDSIDISHSHRRKIAGHQKLVICFMIKSIKFCQVSMSNLRILRSNRLKKNRWGNSTKFDWFISYQIHSQLDVFEAVDIWWTNIWYEIL